MKMPHFCARCNQMVTTPGLCSYCDELRNLNDMAEAKAWIDYLESNGSIDRETLEDWYMAVENESYLQARLDAMTAKHNEGRAHVEALVDIEASNIYIDRNGCDVCIYCAQRAFNADDIEHLACPLFEAREWLAAETTEGDDVLAK